ncbi:MAG: hypothetical protein B6U86_01905 [Candidatus Altiarchaeales archaeon ex4484_43]|nr:MAG: hypothetical protein B6U86_01905 [Candidatus Altiarchaeales archaeon ex4484_43]
MRESFSLLLKKPRIFIPNLFASLLYAFVELIMIKAFIDIIGIMGGADPVGIIRGSLTYLPVEELLPPLLIFGGVILFFPVIGIIDLVTYSMYLKDAISAWRIWLTLGVIFLLFAVFVLTMIGIFAVLTFLLDNPLCLFIGAVLFISLIVLFMMAVFFVMPVGVIEKTGVLESFRESYQLGFRHKGEVIFLNVFVILVIIVAFALGSIFGTEKLGAGITFMAIILFLTVRIIQSLMYTYIYVVNPYFYVGVARMKNPY